MCIRDRLYGADRTLLDFVQSLDTKRWQAVVSLPRKGPLSEALEAAGATVTTGPMLVGKRSTFSKFGLLSLALEFPRAWWYFRKLTKRHRPDLVYTNTLVLLAGAFFARSRRIPHLWHVHEILLKPKLAARIFSFLLDHRANRVVTNSTATLEAYTRWNPSIYRRAKVVHNGIDPRRIAAGISRESARKQLDLEQDAPVVAFIGRINGWKGQGVLIEACSRLRRTRPNLKVIVAGDPPQGQDRFESYLETRIDNLRMWDFVMRLPFQDDIAPVLAAADVLALPSTRPEPFGMVLLEAMAAGLPVVATNQGGPREIVQDQVTGRLVEASDDEQLAKALGPYLDRPLLRARHGLAGAERAENHFSITAYANNLMRNLDVVANGLSFPHAAIPNTATRVHIVLGKAHPGRPNGVNRVVHHLAKAQVDAGHQVEVWGLTADPDAATPVRPYVLRTFHSPLARFLLPRAFKLALRTLPSNARVHLHGAFLPEMAATARILRQEKQPYVFTPHGAYHKAALQHRRFLKRLYMALIEGDMLRKAQAIQAFNEPDAEFIKRFSGRTEVVIVPNGQDIEPVTPPKAGRPLRFGYLGRLDQDVKGLDTLLEGFALYAKRNPNGELWIVGDGPDRAALESQAGALGIHQRVRIRQPRYGESKRSLLAGLDLFIHPSRHEGQPGAPLEAAAFGTALLITEATNLGDEVRKYGAGFVLSELTPQAIAQAISRFMDLPVGRRAQIALAARRMVNAEFSWHKVCSKADNALYRKAS